MSKKKSFFDFLNFKKKKNIKNKTKIIKNSDVIKNINIKNNNKTNTGLFNNLKSKLKNTRNKINDKIINLFFKKKNIDLNIFFKKLEEELLLSDIGINTTVKIIENLKKYSQKNNISEKKELYIILKKILFNIIKNVSIPLEYNSKKPFLILVIGVNGSGKTTSIGKLSNYYIKKKNKSVILAAGDTFRAAAIKQLSIIAQKNNIPIISHKNKSDSASVIFDAFKSAQSKNIDIVIADTAGRLHNKKNLMEELKKIIRVTKKIDIQAPHEIMLVIDATSGQNVLEQVYSFKKYVEVTGLMITKLDGTAKGGVVFSISNQYSIPIRYISIGENEEDIEIFKPNKFIDSLFTD
ncbi:signal recognition particle-docking protein FtsY [Buchnera aphidicola (Kurisakia onigurumii)]|uniref:signal recognition particle-docking protein FtsY n=1 Tax=Buchnera aphidicola TaxID=9 RepID=UPI0031B6FFBC